MAATKARGSSKQGSRARAQKATAEATPRAPRKSKIPLVSPRHRGLTVILTHDELQWLPNGSWRVERKGRKVKFESGRAYVDAETFEILETMGVYTGEGEPKLIWRADTPDAPAAAQGGKTRVRTGAQSTANEAQAMEPIEGYGRMTPVQIESAIEAGRFGDKEGLLSALGFELAPMVGKRRPRVVQAFMAAINEGEPEQAPHRHEDPPGPEAAYRDPGVDDDGAAEIRAAVAAAVDSGDEAGGEGQSEAMPEGMG